MHQLISTKLFITSMLIILITGLTLCFGMAYFLNLPTEGISPISTQPVTKEPVSLDFNLSSPEDNKLVFDSSILIQGKTTPSSTVILSKKSNDQILEVSSSGDFSHTLNLEEGVNEFTIASFDELGNNKSVDRTIYYSKEKI